ncbi:pentapeptide repeat-containing protein [Nonomuraea sp. ZG12]|uniref:pentapeptide repeat-containing protein n=1 Tax=Nonomuraea sp. ZG12 TaxID=3452207 RepID=UPI003F88F653
MRPATIIVAVSGLLLSMAIGWILGPGAPWWLAHVDGVRGLQGEKLAAALDAIRGRALAVGTGLAALMAVFYTARNADTARRTFQLGERGHDTDRYGKAAEQLGHLHAPVRLAGLHALEQLAQNTPALRQTIVDVICAYLRMPYDEAAPRDRDARIRAAQRTARARAPVARPAGRDVREEREVRLTAQRILADHLRYREPPKTRWRRGADSHPRFWPGIRLDLTGAVLCDADFVSCRMAEATFTGATFIGAARFGGVVFTDTASFGTASFTGDAEFGETRFLGAAEFTSTVFAGAARFGGATFERDTIFGFASFEGRAGFSEVVFGGHASFGLVSFGGDARFTGAAFHGNAGFAAARFTGLSGFVEAVFHQQAMFKGATFTSATSFDRATFGGPADFAYTHGAEQVRLHGASVARPADTHRWPPGWRLESEPDGHAVLSAL